jgi:PPE-repeat protein
MLPGAPAPNPALGGALPPPGAVGGAWGLGGGGPVSASVGQAGTIGRLSVPSSWAAAPQQAITPEASSAGLFGANAHGGSAGSGGLLRGVPLVGTGAGRRAAGGFVHRYGFRYAVIPRPPAAG